MTTATQVVLFALVSPFAFFLIALLFLVAGLLTPSSLQRKGTARFLGDRLLRLGVPFVVYVLLVQPTLNYALQHPLGAAPGSYWAEYLGSGRLDTGPLWFVGVLLVFSVGYAGWSNFWEWPACIAVFALGISASRQGWVATVPERLARQCRDLTLPWRDALMPRANTAMQAGHSQKLRSVTPLSDP